jgi:hypothetical protein
MEVFGEGKAPLLFGTVATINTTFETIQVPSVRKEDNPFSLLTEVH